LNLNCKKINIICCYLLRILFHLLVILCLGDAMTRKDFAEGLSFWKLFFFFVIGCLFGTLFEELLYFAMHGSYSCRAGVLYGPFSPLYGFGVVLILLILGRKNNSRGIFLTFILSSLLGGVTEYVVSLIVELFFKIRFWDYSNMFLNIHGRTTIPFMAAWGLFATILLKVLYPFLSKYIEKIPKRIGKLIGLLLLVFLIHSTAWLRAGHFFLNFHPVCFGAALFLMW